MQFEKWYTVDLEKPQNRIAELGFLLFNGDNDSVRLGVELRRNGSAETVSGTVKGLVLMPNGTALADITGDKSENRAWVDLPEPAFALEGRIQIAIRITDGTEKTVVLAAAGTVRRTSSAIAYDPDAEIPTWGDVQDKMDEMDAARQAAEEAASHTYAIVVDEHTLKVVGPEDRQYTVTVTGSTPTITAAEWTRYICGTVSTLDFTPSEYGLCAVRFTSGPTATVLTLPETVKMPPWWTEPEANKTYEINIEDGVYGVVTAWT